MTVTAADGVGCILAMKKYTIIVETSVSKEPPLRIWAQKNGLVPIDLTNASLAEQKVIFKTIQPIPNQYILYTTQRRKEKLYKRLYALILLDVNDDISSNIYSPVSVDLDSVLIVTSIKTYIYDLIIQLRYNRFIHRGVPTYILEMMHDYVKYMAIRDGINYVLPQMVQQAFTDLIPFHIRDCLIKDSQEELTMMYGSDSKLIDEVREVINEYDVMRIVLEQVPAV